MTNKRKNLKLIKIALSFIIMTLIMSAYGGVAFAESITSSLDPGDYEILDVSNNNAIISANEAIATSVINETWYYVTQNSTSENIEIPFVIYGATLARPNETKPEQSSSKITGKDILEPGVTRMYIYTCFTGDGSKEIVELASVDITLNSAGEIESTSNATTLLAIAWGVEKTSSYANDCLVYVNSLHTYSIKANSKVVETDKWVHATSGTEELVGFADPWSSKSVQYFRYINRYHKVESAKLSNLYNNAIRPWYFKYDDNRLIVTDSTVANEDNPSSPDIDTYNGTSLSVDEFPRYNAGYLKSFTAPRMKPAGSLTLDKYVLELEADGNSQDVIATRLGDGVVSASSSNTDVATVVVNGTTITVTPKDVGIATITVSVGEGTNYLAPENKTVTVTVVNPNYKDSEGNLYGTLKKAFDNAKSGSTITTLRDVLDNSDAIVANGKTFILDINGKTITKTVNGITNNGTLTIKGAGTIKTNTNDAVNLMVINMETLTIGENSGTKVLPEIQGDKYGVYSKSSFNFYDGILKGKLSAYTIMSESVTDPAIPVGYEIYHGTEIIDEEEYQTAYLVPYLMQRETQSPTEENADYKNDYMIGAERAGLTQYTSDLVTSITLHDAIDIPNGAPNWDVSYLSNGSIIAWLVSDGNGKYELNIGAKGKMYAINCYRLFAEYKNCTAINNLYLLDTSKVKDMHGMFHSLQKVSELDVSRFNTSSVTDMSGMFGDCTSLTGINVSGFDTSNVTNLSYMFYYCKSLKSLEVSSFDTSNATRMDCMFKYCEELTSLDLSNFDTTSVTNMSSMFYNCSSLQDLNVSGFNTSSVTNMSYMFNYCSSLQNLDVNNFDTSYVTDMSYMFNYCNNLQNLDVSKFDTSSVTNMNYMFNNCSSLQSLDVSNFRTSTDMNSMFSGCKTLANIDLSNFNTTNVTETTSMFYNCTNLKTIHLGKNFNKLNGTDMFQNCTNLTAIITPSRTPMTLSTDTGIGTSTVLYVLTDELKTTFESATNYSTVFGADRIKPILEIVGSNPANVEIGSTYEDEGATVAGYNYDEASMYSAYGYYLEVTGLPIDTTTSSVQEVIYTLKYAE